MATKRKQASTPLDRQQENIKIWLEAIEDYTERLNDWERGFVNNVADTFHHGFDLSEKQYNRLEEIYRKFY